MRAAIVIAGVVQNVVELNNLGELPGAIACPDNDIGDGFDGYSFSKPVVPPKPLPEIQAQAHASIDTEAGAARARYITVAPGQEATYILKESQSRAYKAAGYPSAAVVGYLMVNAEARAINGPAPDATQIQSAADGIIAQADAWIAKAAEIERARIAGKRAVSAAADVTAAETARAAAVAELGAM